MAVTGCLAALGAVFTLVVAGEVVKAMFRRGVEVEGGHALAILFLLAGTAALVQLYRLDLYVGKDGVRQRTFLRTKTWNWSAIQEFRIKPMAGLRLLGGYAIWIRLTDGREVETSVHYAESLPALRGVFMAEHEAQEILQQLQGALTRSRNAVSQPR